MKTRSFVLIAAAMLAIPSAAAAQDRAAENRAAVRRMFPVVTLFDKKKAPAAEATTVSGDPATAAAAAPAPVPAGEPLAAMHALASAPGDTRDIAGIHLGMTPDQVKAAAAASGYVRGETKTQYSWASVVRQEEEFRRLPKLYPATADQVLGSETYSGPGSQKLNVSYTPTPRGLFVYSVRYSVNMSETTWETMKERARGKYGRESYANASKLVFCLRGETRCDAFAQYQRPNIELDYMVGSSWLTLEQGKQYQDAYTRARNAEIDRLHPKNERPAF